MSTTEAIAPDLHAVKQRQQTMWASGDFHAVATLIQPVAEDLCEAVDLRADWRVLDVATGSGNAALAAARRGCDVVGIDYVPALLARGRRRAEAEGLDIELVEGDAESIPFPDASFDAVLSVYGAMFAPDHEKTFAELARVCRPGGRIGLATWIPDGFIGEMLKVVSAHVPPAPGVASPLLWGTKAYIGSMFGHTIDGLGARERTFTFLPLRRGLRRVLSRLLRADAQGVRGRRGRGSRRAVRRSGRARPKARGHLRRPGRDPRDMARDGRHALRGDRTGLRRGPGAAGRGKPRRTDLSGLDELSLDVGGDVTRDLDERAGGGGAVAVPVPDDGDAASRDLGHQPDRRDALVAR